jgi:hypothetical protein
MDTAPTPGDIAPPGRRGRSAGSTGGCSGRRRKENLHQVRGNEVQLLGPLHGLPERPRAIRRGRSRRPGKPHGGRVAGPTDSDALLPGLPKGMGGHPAPPGPMVPARLDQGPCFAGLPRRQGRHRKHSPPLLPVQFPQECGQPRRPGARRTARFRSRMDRPALNASMSSATAVPPNLGQVRHPAPNAQVMSARIPRSHMSRDSGAGGPTWATDTLDRSISSSIDRSLAAKIQEMPDRSASASRQGRSAPCPCRAPAGAQVLYQRRIGSLALNGCRAPSRCIHPWVARAVESFQPRLMAPRDGPVARATAAKLP